MSTIAERIRRFLTWLLQLLSSLHRPPRSLLILLGWFYNSNPNDPSHQTQMGWRPECNPIPLPTQRPRRLTLPTSTSETSEATGSQLSLPHPQTQSPLFTKLPLELRQSIYRYALANRVLHITRLPTRLAHVTCFHPPLSPSSHFQNSLSTYPEQSPSSHSCWGIRAPNTTLYNGLADERLTHDKDKLSALLKTCKRVYTESVPFLYSANVFDVNTPETLCLLKQTVLASRIRAISAVQMTWAFVSSDERDVSESLGMRKGAWTEVWAVLGGMTGLRSLYVELGLDSASVMRGGTSAEDAERVVFQKAKTVRLSGGGKWMLVLHWEPGKGAVEMDDLPFRVEYRPNG